MRGAIVRFLRWLAVKLGGESDLDLLARTYGIVRLGPRVGTKDDIEFAIRAQLPTCLDPAIEWSEDGRTMTMRLR